MARNKSGTGNLESAKEYLAVSSSTVSTDIPGIGPDRMRAASSPFMQSNIITDNTGLPVTVAVGAVAELGGVSAQAVAFTGETGTLKLDDSVAFTGLVSGLTGSDAIDFADISYGAETTATFLGTTSGGTLTVTDGTSTANIALIGNYLSSGWTITSDDNGGTLVVDPVPSNTWQTLDVGAGGYLTGMDIAPDDTMVVRTDTHGAYVWNGNEWQQLVTATSMPAAFVTTKASQGVYEVEIAPSNSDIMYMMYEGYVFRSTDKGNTWTQTSFVPVTESPNDAYRMDGQKMAIDPENPNVVYVGTPQNGLFVTTDGGATWQSVTAVPVSLKDKNGIYPGITGIEMDPALGVTGGITNTIFAASYGNGVYESTNGGTSWSAIGGPSDVEFAAVSSTGIYYAVGNGNSLWSYSSGTWTELLLDTSGNGIATVAVDPFNPNEIVVQTPGGSLNISFNGGGTWSGDNWGNQLASTDVPWLAKTAAYLSVGGTLFDQVVPNKLWVSDGVGVWNTTNLPTQTFKSGTPVIWNDQSVGIEQLVANEVLVPPGGDPVLASWDRAFFYITNGNSYPSTYGPVNGKFAAGWSVDYASSDPSFLVGIADWWGNEESGYSTNGGQSWTEFPTFLPGAGSAFMGGTIAASSPTDIIWAPSGGEDPYYTLDGGQTWNPITLPGVSSWSGFDSAYYLDTRTVTADRVLPNTFYLYDAGHGVYESTNGGVSWTQVFSGQISAFSNFSAELQSVPGEAGNLFFTGGPQTSFPTEGFFRSTDQGTTWTAVPDVAQVSCFGFGAPAPGQSYPSIYIVGYVNGVYGIWQSINDAQSWTQIGTYPTGDLDQIKTISGDPNVFGQVYVGFSGSGYAYLSAGPAIVGMQASPQSGAEGVGNIVTLTLDMSEAVTVTGTPMLTLNDGGSAIYTGGSGSDALTFSYTVAAGQNTASLSVTAINLNSSTLADTAGNAASLDLTGISQTGPAIDTTPPAAPVIASDAVNGNNSVTLAGSAESNSTVTVYNGNTVLGTATTNANGNWSFTTVPQGVGAQVFTATATDAAGNTSPASVALDPVIGPPVMTIVSAGNTVSGTIVSNGGGLFDGGTAVNTSVQAGGFLTVSSGGIATGTTVINGDIFDRGRTSGTHISGGGNEFVSGGGVASGTQVSNGGTERILAGGTGISTTISTGGAEFDTGIIISASVQSGAFLAVSSGGAASGTSVTGGNIFVLSSGTASGTQVNAGAGDYVSSGGIDSGTVISRGGAEFDFGSAANATVLAGAFLLIESGARATGVNVTGGNIFDFGKASGTHVGAGGVEYVLAGGSDSGTIVSRGGTESIAFGGTAIGTAVSGAALDAGAALNATVLAGGSLTVSSGGIATGTTTISANIFVSGTTSGTNLSNGGTEFVSSGGSDIGTTISNGGAEFVLNGASATSTTVLGGGFEQVSSGGTLIGATLSGGSIDLQNGAIGSGTFNFASGGMLTLDGTGNYDMLVANFTSATAVIDLTQINDATLSATFTQGAGSATLALTDGTHSASLLLMGNYAAGLANFNFSADNGGGTFVSDPPVAPTNLNVIASPH